MTLDVMGKQVMFKAGDDLRQDQLILQLITLMDRLLRKENLDLKLRPYNVLACSGNPPYHGKSCSLTCSTCYMCVYRFPTVDTGYTCCGTCAVLL